LLCLKFKDRKTQVRAVSLFHSLLTFTTIHLRWLSESLIVFT
jgi:hypothetical protein